MSEKDIPEKINGLSSEVASTMLVNYVTDAFLLVEWPESQEYMEEEWFDEAVLHPDLPSAYFIPAKYLF